jgi:hypothetical protein
VTTKGVNLGEWVRIEGHEGKRRGILIPVLLDDVDLFERLGSAVARSSSATHGAHAATQPLPAHPLRTLSDNLRYLLKSAQSSWDKLKCQMDVILVQTAYSEREE